MILDTCALLWLAAGSNDLTRNTLKKIEETNVIYVSAITGFEIAIKAAKGKLKLSKKPREWFDAVVSFHRLTVLPLNLNICLGATELAPFHNDPCDRFIIATAKIHNLAVVTSDQNFARYGLRILI
jgi:PIN domain nuclease of toxin-antitoxin system